MPYQDQYAEFWKRQDKATGYEFGQAPMGNVSPPTVSFPKPLKWWSWDRPRRVRSLLRSRDQRLKEILRLGPAPAVRPARYDGAGQTKNVRSGFRQTDPAHRESSNQCDGEACLDEQMVHAA